MARRLDQRVLLLLFALEHRIEQSLAHAQRGEHHLPRLADAQDVFEHERRVRQQRPPRIVHHFDIRQRFDIDPMHQSGELERFVGGNGIAVHHVQRIAGLPHVQPRHRAPGAADGIEGAVLASLEHRQPAERFLDEFFRLFQRLRRYVGERQTAERAGQSIPRARAADIDQFQRPAAEIADDAVGAMHAGDDAERGELGLARAGENIDLGLQRALGGANEGTAVLGVAARRRGDGERFTHPHPLAQRAVALERRQRVLDRVRGEKPGGLHLAAQAAQRLFVEYFRRTAGEPFVNHKPHGIRADVDDSDRRAVIEASLGVEFGALHW